jgi:hypothetical protein
MDVGLLAFVILAALFVAACRPRQPYLRDDYTEPTDDRR